MERPKKTIQVYQYNKKSTVILIFVLVIIIFAYFALSVTQTTLENDKTASIVCQTIHELNEGKNEEDNTDFNKSWSDGLERISIISYAKEMCAIVLAENHKVLTFGQLAVKAVDNMLRTGKIQESTYLRKLETLKRLKPLDHIPMTRITEDDMDAFFEKEVLKKISESTLSKDIAIIRATFNLAEKRKIITPYDNFMRYYEKPKSIQKRKPVRAPTLEEEEKLLRVILENDIPFGEVMLVMLFTGLRPGEVLALNVEDIDLKGKRLFVSKTLTQNIHRQTIVGDKTKTPAGMRMVTLSDAAVKILARIIDDRTTGLLFSDDGKIINVARVRYFLYQTLNRYGILSITPNEKVTFHSLRHPYVKSTTKKYLFFLVPTIQLS